MCSRPTIEVCKMSEFENLKLGSHSFWLPKFRGKFGLNPLSESRFGERLQ
jgi:hypothetical protein